MEFYNNCKFDWDENKSRKNLKKHKVSFHEARTVFESHFLPLTENDDLHSQDEQRYKTTGYSSKNRLLIVSHTDRGDTIRIISARKANKQEKADYEQSIEYLPFG